VLYARQRAPAVLRVAFITVVGRPIAGFAEAPTYFERILPPLMEGSTLHCMQGLLAGQPSLPSSAVDCQLRDTSI